MTDKTKKIMTRKGLVTVGVILVAVVCSSVSGCASLVRKEKERALLESYEKGKINKIEYESQKYELEQETNLAPSQKN